MSTQPPIIVTVSGGVIQNISHIPSTVKVVVHDYDVDEEDVHPLTKANGAAFCISQWASSDSDEEVSILPQVKAADGFFKLFEACTSHMTLSDSELSSDEESPQRMAEHDDKYGIFFSVPSDDIDEAIAHLTNFGYSAAFIRLFAHAHRQGATYMYLDGACTEVNGFPTFEW
jgi:hypothetical protein